MRVIYWRRKWWARALHTRDVFLMAEDGMGRQETIVRFHHEDGSKAPPGWYAKAEWLPPGFRRFPTLLAAFRWAGGRSLLEVMPPTVPDYEDRRVLDGIRGNA